MLLSSRIWAAMSAVCLFVCWRCGSESGGGFEKQEIERLKDVVMQSGCEADLILLWCTSMYRRAVLAGYPTYIITGKYLSMYYLVYTMVVLFC